jgi:RNA polymerase sigma-70 factor (ECF subfamily)
MRPLSRRRDFFRTAANHPAGNGISDAMGRRDRQDFEALWHLHRGIALKVAGVYARSAEDRRDLAQEIAMQSWRSFARYDPRRAKFSTWLYRVALNVAISHARRHPWSDADRIEPLETHHLETIGGESVAERDERLDALHAFIGQLDALNRALILLYLEDRSYAEIAEVLGISETNVATKINRIKHKLRGQMTTTATTGA